MPELTNPADLVTRNLIQKHLGITRAAATVRLQVLLPSTLALLAEAAANLESAEPDDVNQFLSLFATAESEHATETNAAAAAAVSTPEPPPASSPADEPPGEHQTTSPAASDPLAPPAAQPHSELPGE